jgi:hypothetical protein
MKEELESQWMDVKKRYQELIDKRVQLVVDGKFEELKKQNGSMKNFFPEEVKLFKESEAIRKKLIRYRPELGGKINKRDRQVRVSDNGFYVCSCCRKMFHFFNFGEGGKVTKERTEYITHTLNRCEEHEHQEPFKEEETCQLQRIS